MTQFHNTLFVTTQGTFLGKDHETIAVRQDGKTTLAVPFHHLAGIVCFGRVLVSPELMGACAERGVAISFLTERGRFLARVEGPAAGNVLLRRAQYRLADDPAACLRFAKGFLAGKIANARAVLQRAARDSDPGASRETLEGAAERLRHSLAALERASSLDEARGHEGEAATVYFDAVNAAIRRHADAFRFERRSRRPPTDPLNALLSFLYTVTLHDVSSALQSVGLDPSVGFLHVDRPGRPSLALDLLEEFRPALADRLALALINLGQIAPDGFVTDETGGVRMTDEIRRTVLTAFQNRKQEPHLHPFLEERTTVGLLPFLQARLLARAVRGELDAYPPFVLR